MGRLILLLATLVVFTSSIGQNQENPFQQTGKASYYATKFEGRKTASGELYSNTKLTAAHQTLPFGTLIKVTNLSNNKTVEVRINDRGPFIKGRIIDVSQEAAKQLGFLQKGVTQVQIEIAETTHLAD